MDGDRSGRARLRRACAAAVAVPVLASGCGTVGALEPADGPAPGDRSTARPDGRALDSAVLERWADFDPSVGRRPVVLLDEGVFPPGFGSDEKDEAFAYRSWELPRDLPQTPEQADGGPVISAQDALDALREANPVGTGDGPRATVTAMRLGSSTFRTDRGEQSLPAWFVTFRGGPGPAVVAAVAAPARRFYERDAGPTPDVVDHVRVAADGRTLTIFYTGAQPGTGRCQKNYTARSLETAGAVAVEVVPLDAPGSSSSDDENELCPAVGYRRELDVTLAAPLGGRVVVETGRGNPVLATGPGLADGSSEVVRQVPAETLQKIRKSGGDSISPVDAATAAPEIGRDEAVAIAVRKFGFVSESRRKSATLAKLTITQAGRSDPLNPDRIIPDVQDRLAWIVVLGGVSVPSTNPPPIDALSDTEAEKQRERQPAREMQDIVVYIDAGDGKMLRGMTL